MNMQVLLPMLQEAMGFEKLHTDANNAITFNFEDVYITAQEHEEIFLLVTRLCDVPHDPKDIFSLALQENNYAINEGYVSINVGNASFIFTSKIPTHMLCNEVFIKKFHKHIDAAQKIRTKLLQHMNRVAPQAAATDGHKPFSAHMATLGRV